MSTHLIRPPNLFQKIKCSIKAGFQGPFVQKMTSKIVDRAFLGPLIYSFVTVFIFALVYGLIGYKNLFETNDENRDKNVENSIVGSLMIQSNAMGIVKPINSLGNWLLTAQTFLGWVYFLCLIYVFVN